MPYRVPTTGRRPPSCGRPLFEESVPAKVGVRLPAKPGAGQFPRKCTSGGRGHASCHALTSSCCRPDHVHVLDMFTPTYAADAAGRPAAATPAAATRTRARLAHTFPLTFLAKFTGVPKPRFPINNFCFQVNCSSIHGKTSVYKLER